MKHILGFLLLIATLNSYGQFTRYQYFDGADTIPLYSVIIDKDSSSSWQIGPPTKIIFDSAATLPNVIATQLDTTYLSLDSSSFSFGIDHRQFLWGIIAIQWKQKLDFEGGVDGGVIHFSTDSGNTWTNVMNHPYVYSFYGFQTRNLDTLPNNTYAFSGTDSAWTDVWLCFDASWLSFQDSVRFQFSIYSDSNDTQQEGWMIDNFIQRFTIVHTLKEEELDEYISLSPNPTNGEVNIRTQKRNEMHIIQNIKLRNANGEIVKEWGLSPTKYQINVNEFPDGIYYLQITTNFKTEIHELLIQK